MLGETETVILCLWQNDKHRLPGSDISWIAPSFPHDQQPTSADARWFQRRLRVRAMVVTESFSLRFFPETAPTKSDPLQIQKYDRPHTHNDSSNVMIFRPTLVLSILAVAAATPFKVRMYGAARVVCVGSVPTAIKAWIVGRSVRQSVSRSPHLMFVRRPRHALYQISTVTRKLEDAPYEILAGVVDYNNGVDPGTGNILDNPTLLIGFEHVDVTDQATAESDPGTENPVGQIRINHYFRGCDQEIPRASPFESQVGESAPITLGPDNGQALADRTGFVDSTLVPYNFQLTNNAGDENGAITIVRYELANLESVEDEGVVTMFTNNGGPTDVRIQFCTGIELLDFAADPNVLGFRFLDVTVEFTIDNTATVDVSTQEDVGGQNPPEIDLGNFSVDLFILDPDTSTATDPMGFDPTINQGDSFAVALVPQSDFNVADPSSPLATPENTLVVEIVSVDTCTFWYDEDGNGFLDDSEDIRLEVISGGVEQSPSASDLDCDTEFNGCTFTILSLPAPFFPDEGLEITARCEVTLEFVGGVRRRVQALATGDQFNLEATAVVGMGAEIGDGDSCTDGCFFLFCFFRFIVCFWLSIFDGSGF